MKRLVLAIPHSHTFFWTQTCVNALRVFPPRANGIECQVVVVDNSPWSPAIKGITETSLGDNVTVIPNTKPNKFHASALDLVVEQFDFDYLMAWETDVLALREDWLPWFLSHLQDTDFACGHWHHENFINPSCTLYRGNVLRDMLAWCKANAEPELLRWGPGFENVQRIAERSPERDYKDWWNDNIEWIVGPFADKRGWPAGYSLKESPSGQFKGPGWYEPGQMLHAWAVESGYTYTSLPTQSHSNKPGVPVQTLYGLESNPNRELNIFELLDSFAFTVHLWGGTRALDIIKHEVTCETVKGYTPYWLGREANFWRDSVPEDVRKKTLDLIREHGWHIKGCGHENVTDRDKEAAAYVKACYANGGVKI